MSSDETRVYNGRVKWFNNKAGYGFITVIDGGDAEFVGKDIFSHHSAINVGEEQYKYLVQGEYVEFSLSKVEGEKSTHEHQAASIKGVKGGKLLCETRNETRITNPGKTQNRRNTNPRGTGPRDENQEEWVLSKNKGSSTRGKGANKE